MIRVKSILSLLLVLVMILSLKPEVLAAVADTGFSDVSAVDWYAGAVKYCIDHNLMSGTEADKFSPDTPMSRVMLAASLYRMAGSPEVTGTSGFNDVPQGTWYSYAVTWASQNGIVSGYGSGLFGVNDSVTREQISTILWRYSGSPAASDTTTASFFSDAANISSYAVEAVAWSRRIGIINGKPGNLFEPKGNATRAEVAAILWNYLSIERTALTPPPTPTPSLQPIPALEPYIKNVTVTVGSSVFYVKLYDNDTARAFQKMLPITLNMSELNGNEKYYYLSDKLMTDSQQVGSIKTGDLMLYGPDCLVLFYTSFTTTYSYTKLGYIENVSGLADALGRGSIQVRFAVENYGESTSKIPQR